jgi:signal-transduction protein with cAMP-binding, CBS, and nucleotidyltransferase domain
VTDNHWGGILHARNSVEIAAQFNNSLVARLTLIDSGEALKTLQGVRDELLKEISAGRRISAEIENLIGKLPKIHYADQLLSSMARFIQLAAELYTTRSSVSSTLSHAQSFYDSLVTAAFNHTATLLKKEGKDVTGLNYALLVSGELGRGESVLGWRSRFFFIHQEVATSDQKNIHELAMRFMAVLSICFPDISRNLHNSSTYWFGSAEQWRKTAADLIGTGKTDNWDETGGRNFTLFVETAADMRTVGGNADFGRGIREATRQLLADCLQSSAFWHLAKDTAAMPVALGVFRRFKTVRTGGNRGKINLQGMALDPLAAAARLLALACGSDETSLSKRIHAILAAGNMGVALADRLLIAYQDFMRERIRLELTGSKGTDELFADPEELGEETKERFRAGLEDIITLQRLVHQQLVEVKPS